jgi:hypothetical protein
MITLIFTVYIVGILVAFFCLYYKNLRLSRNGKYYYAEITPDIVFPSVFWPFALIVLIIITPFKLLCKLAEKLKKVNNPKKISL